MLPVASKTRDGFKAPGADEFFNGPISVFGYKLNWHIGGHFDAATGDLKGGLDLGINRVVLLEFAAAGVLCLLFSFAFRRASVVPRGTQNILEVIIEFIRADIVVGVLGHHGHKFQRYLISLFFFIWMCNLFEIIPGVSFPVNSRTGLPVAFALITFATFIYQGVKNNGAAGYFRSALFPPGVPIPIYILITPIELISTFILRPVTLTIRLAANMIAGHLLLGVFYAATAYLFAGPLYGKGFTAIFGVGSFLAAIAFTAFEFLVAALQAYIFTLLTGVYLAGAIEPEH